MKQSILDELSWRGLIYQKTPHIETALLNGTTIYWGIDPTGDSLHVGHFMGITMLRRLAECGHKIIVLAGGGTAKIGDPGGKDEERPIVPKEIIDSNKEKIKQQISKFFTFDQTTVRMVDNADWLEKVPLIDFLRDAGKYATVNSMIDKDSVANRIGREHGISYAEFSYQLLQAYDFMELYKRYGCEVQVAGSDQWGNMVQGIELIRKSMNREVFALSWPLIVNPETGRKFGKTETGAAIWLDPAKTHPFDFFQFFVNVGDALAPQLLRFFSFKSRTQLEEIEAKWIKEERTLQKELAYELTSMVHGADIAQMAQKVTSILFERNEQKLSQEDLEFIKTAVPHARVPNVEAFVLENALFNLGFVKSKTEARRLVQQKGARSELLFDKYFLVHKGKREYGIVEID